MDDLLNEFLTETTESLDIVDSELVKLEQDPGNTAVLDNIFRLVHTIKGTCGFLGLPRLERVAHASENVLGKFRGGELEVTPEAVTTVLDSLDRIKEILAVLEAEGEEPAGDDTGLIGRLDAVAKQAQDAPAADVAPSDATEEAGVSDGSQVSNPGPGGGPSQEELDALEAAWQAAPGPEDPPEEAPEQDCDEGASAAPAPTAATDAGKAGDSSEDPDDPPAAPGDGGDPASAGNAPSIANQSIRVDVDLLEDLMTMVSELVLTRNQLMQMVRQRDDSQLSVPLQQLNHCTTELQEGVMKTRMQPIGNAWGKLPRIVRDLSIDLGKKITLQKRGEETELDRQVLELIRDPLTHMVRNSVDHGIETPEERQRAGKEETGHIQLNAYHEGGYILIEIKDDGRGLSVDRIKQKALANSLVSEAELATMTDQQIQKFIFHPGLSTAQTVTSVSGRGVGMDVVRSNIEKIGGTIDLTSTEGHGTTFVIKIPLTLAIVSALIVECGSHCFAIPQLSVLELVRDAEQSDYKIERINDTPVLRLRNRLLPLVHLKQLLGVEAENAADDGDNFIVVTQVGSFTFGIVVDQVFDTEEIVVKPVSPLLRDLPYYSGNTILGDGRVIMILDPNGVANAATQTVSDTASDIASEERHQELEETSSMLIFRAGEGSPKAVPLSLVSRLEELDATTIEDAGGTHLIQYRGQLMPLVKANDNFDLRSEGRQPILVFADESKSIGLAVDEIVDIVEEHVDMEVSKGAEGVIGTAVIAGKASEIIDVGYYLNKAFNNFFAKRGNGDEGWTSSVRRILVVDDSPFFRNLLKPLLTAAGYQVTVVDGTQEALSLRDAGEEFDIIVSDIDMPDMDGFTFAERIKTEGSWTDVPLIALSGHTAAGNAEKGQAAGFMSYVPKFDRDGLLTALSDALEMRGTAA